MRREEGGGDGGSEHSCGKDREEGRGKRGETEDAQPPGLGKGMDRREESHLRGHQGKEK